MLDRTVAPEVKELHDFPITKAVSGTLSNGIPIHYIRSGSQEVIKIEIIYNAGNYFEPKPVVSLLTAKMLGEGTQQKSAKEISNTIASYGAYIEYIPGNDKLIIALTTLNKYIPFLLPILKELIQESVFPEKNFENLKNIYQQQLKINLEKTGFVSSGLFKKAIFGEHHPYGYFVSDNSFNQVELTDCLAFYNTTIKESNFEIVVSGMANEGVVKEINNILGRDKIRFPSPLSLKKEVRGEGYSVREEKENAVQCSIKIGRKLFTRNHPDYVKFLVLNELLGGFFGSRLMKNIREDKGLTYGIHSTVTNFIQEGYFLIGTDVKKELVDVALTEIYKEISILKSSLVGDEELNTVKNYMMGTYLNSLTTPFSLAEKFKAIHFHNLDYSYYERYVKTIKQVKAKDLLQLAEKYLDKGNLTEVVVG